MIGNHHDNETGWELPANLLTLAFYEEVCNNDVRALTITNNKKEKVRLKVDLALKNGYSVLLKGKLKDEFDGIIG